MAITIKELKEIIKDEDDDKKVYISITRPVQHAPHIEPILSVGRIEYESIVVIEV